MKVLTHLSLHLSSCHSKGTTRGTWLPVDCHISDQAVAVDTSKHSWDTLHPIR